MNTNFKDAPYNVSDNKSNYDTLSKNTNLKVAPYNVSDIGDNTKFNYDTLSTKYINKAKHALSVYNFKFPNEQLFTDKINEVFKFKINEYKNDIIALRPAMFPEIVVKNDKFILVEDPEFDDKEELNSTLLYNYNNYIFYNNTTSFLWLKLRASYLLDDLLVIYGYNGDKELAEFVLTQFDYFNSTSFHALLFDKINGKNKIREGFLDDIETFIYKGATEDFSYAKEGEAYVNIGKIINDIRENNENYLDPDKTIAFLYEKELRIGITGDIKSFLDANIFYKDFLRNKNYYDYERLKKYVNIIYEHEDREENKNTYIIDDPDGYVNVREGKGTAYNVIGTIPNGAQVKVLIIPTDSDWWRIKYQDIVGYVHKSRIKQVQEKELPKNKKPKMLGGHILVDPY